jgi:hypothetical protein
LANRSPRIETPAAGCAAAKVRETYGQLTLSFEANYGQADGSVDFVARVAGYTVAPFSDPGSLSMADCGWRIAESKNNSA